MGDHLSCYVEPSPRYMYSAFSKLSLHGSEFCSSHHPSIGIQGAFVWVIMLRERWQQLCCEGIRTNCNTKVSVREKTGWKRKGIRVHMCSGLVELSGVASSNRRNISRLTAAHSFPRHKPHSETVPWKKNVGYYNSVHVYAYKDKKAVEDVRKIPGQFVVILSWLSDVIYYVQS